MSRKIIDLFAGVGGLSLGFEKAGFEIALANEYDPSIAAAYVHNRPGVNMVVADITQLDIEKTFEPFKGQIDVVIGGPPCQGFSQKGQRKSVLDERNFLFKYYYEVVKYVQPTYFVMENRDEEKHYSYKVRYKDFCYAVAKTCTEVIKSYGIYGYHCAHMRLQKRSHCSFEQCDRFFGYESNLTMASTVRESSLCLPGVWIALSISFLFERIYLLSTGLLASSRNAYPSIHTPMS